MRGTSTPHAKLTGDFANATEAIRIADRFPLGNFAKKSSLYNFRLLQQYRHFSDIAHVAAQDAIGAKMG
jgi:hypothetical protein